MESLPIVMAWSYINAAIGKVVSEMGADGGWEGNTLIAIVRK